MPCVLKHVGFRIGQSPEPFRKIGWVKNKIVPAPADQGGVIVEHTQIFLHLFNHAETVVAFC